MSVILKAENLTKQFEIRGSVFKPQLQTTLDNFSLNIYDGQPIITAIAGESGSGKTTLARLLLGFIPGALNEDLKMSLLTNGSLR